MSHPKEHGPADAAGEPTAPETQVEIPSEAVSDAVVPEESTPAVAAPNGEDAPALNETEGKEKDNEKDGKDKADEKEQADDPVEKASEASSDKAEGAEDSSEPSDAAAPTDSADSAEPTEVLPGNRRIVMRRGAKWGGIILLALTLAALIAAALVRWDLFSRPVATASGEPTVDIFVEEGDSALRIMNRIVEAGLDVTPLELRAAARLHDRGFSRVHAGLYRFEAGRSVTAILDRLAEGPWIDQQVRIPDGVPIWTARQLLREAVNLKPVSAEMTDEELRKALGLEAYPSIEGFIAPETYRYGSGTPDLMVLRRAVDRQKKLLNEAWTTRSPAAQVKTPYELLILASIIERETGVKSDRHLVSSVFHNRLMVGMPLQTDPTVIYGLGEAWNGKITKKDLQTYTPYNTYRITGLPPTPIGMPTPASIEAAAHPAESRYLYFVSRGDGSSEFTTNLKDHNRAVRHFILEKRRTPFAPSAASPKDEKTPLRPR